MPRQALIQTMISIYAILIVREWPGLLMLVTIKDFELEDASQKDTPWRKQDEENTYLTTWLV